MTEAQGGGTGAALGEQARQDGKGQSEDHPTVGEASWVAAGRDSASSGDIDFGGVQGAQPGAEFVKLVILLKKSFSENQKKIFRTQMLYIARSELG